MKEVYIEEAYLGEVYMEEVYLEIYIEEVYLLNGCLDSRLSRCVCALPHLYSLR